MRVSPKAVIFDYGNVLSDAQHSTEIEAMASILRWSVAQFTEHYWEFRVEYDAGSLDPAAYWGRVADRASRRLTAAQIDQLIEIDSHSWSHPGPLVPQWARDLRAAGIRTAILSNMPVPVRDSIVQCSWLPQFDSQTFSCDVGICKPDPEIYWTCLTRLGVEPREALFIDDRESNVRAAVDIGLHAVKFASPQDAASDIERRFLLPVPFLYKNNCL